MKKMTAIFLAFILLFSYVMPVHATAGDNGEEATTEHPETTEYPDDPSRQPDLVANESFLQHSLLFLLQKNTPQAPSLMPFFAYSQHLHLLPAVPDLQSVQTPVPDSSKIIFFLFFMFFPPDFP